MKMDYVKQRADSSSDESDDVIPPTPAAKSTPLAYPNRKRQQSSSSDSSSNKVTLQTSRPPGFVPKNTTYDDSSSEDEEGTHNATPRSSHINVKREQSESSDDEDMFKTQSIQMSSNQINRSTHAMSSSDSDDSTQEQTIVRNQQNQENDSSEDSDNDTVSKPPAFNALAKIEKPSPPESSDESDREDHSKATGNVPAFSYAPSDSSSEDEGLGSKQAPKEAETSSDESDEEQGNPGLTTVKQPATHNSSSDETDEEKGKLTSHQPSKDTSSDESGDEVVEPKPSVRRTNDSDDSDDSEDEVEERKPVVRKSDDSDESEDEVEKSNKVASGNNESDDSDSDHPQLNQSSARPETYSDSSSEDEPDNNPKPSLPLQNKANVSNFGGGEDESSDEEQSSKPLPSTSRGHPSQEQSSDESSEDEKNEGHVKQPLSVPTTKVLNKVSSAQDSSDDSTDASENEGHQKSLQSHGAQVRHEREETHDLNSGPKRQSKITDSFMHQSNNFPLRNQLQNTPPSSGKKGKALLKETFKERDVFRMESAVLTAEDIGSDDEIWLLQCPSSMDFSALKKQSINLASDCDIQLEDGPAFKRFSVTPECSSNSSINCVLQNKSGFQISSLPIKGKVVIQEHVHVPKLKLPEKSVKGPVPFPSGLKVRHPLLGIEFEKHIAQAQRALKASERYERKKKKKHSSGDRLPVEANGEGRSLSHSSNHIVPSSSLQSNEKKDKKLKHKLPYENQSNGTAKDGSSNKKKKKESSEVQNSNYERLEKSQSFDGSYLNDTYRKKDKKSKVDTQSSARDSHKQEVVVKGQKVLIKSEPCDTSDDSLSRKKSKKSKRGDSTVEERPGQTSNISRKTSFSDQIPVSAHPEESSQKKKSRKSKEDNVLLGPSKIKQEYNLMNGTSEPTSDTFFSKKSKRKHPEDIPADLSQTPPKKRKKHSV